MSFLSALFMIISVVAAIIPAMNPAMWAMCAFGVFAATAAAIDVVSQINISHGASGLSFCQESTIASPMTPEIAPEAPITGLPSSSMCAYAAARPSRK